MVWKTLRPDYVKIDGAYSGKKQHYEQKGTRRES